MERYSNNFSSYFVSEYLCTSKNCIHKNLPRRYPNPKYFFSQLNTESHNLLLASLNVTENPKSSIILVSSHNLQYTNFTESSSNQRACSFPSYRLSERDEKRSSHLSRWLLTTLASYRSIFHLVRYAIHKERNTPVDFHL